MSAYYNECDGKKAAWLRELMREGIVADGEVDERSIEEVKASDLAGFSQCHFFAGIGCWSYALRLAGWPDDRPVWTGSCPCPSFSCAGKGKGFEDPRHLWPAWFGLIRECRPPAIFGEQVNAAIGYGWLDIVQSDMEGASYAVGKAVLGACSVGAPHIRQRLYFAAYAAQRGSGSRDGESRQGNGRTVAAGGFGIRQPSDADGWFPADGDVQRSGQQRLLAEDCGSGDDSDSQCYGWIEGPEKICEGQSFISGDGKAVCNRNASRARFQEQPSERSVPCQKMDRDTRESLNRTGATRGFWADCDWWYGRDGKYRPIESGIQPLGHGTPNRVLKLRGYGDAIVPQVAAEFIGATAETFETDKNRLMKFLARQLGGRKPA